MLNLIRLLEYLKLSNKLSDKMKSQKTYIENNQYVTLDNNSNFYNNNENYVFSFYLNLLP